MCILKLSGESSSISIVYIQSTSLKHFWSQPRVATSEITLYLAVPHLASFFSLGCWCLLLTHQFGLILKVMNDTAFKFLCKPQYMSYMTVLQIFGMSVKNTIKTNAAIKSTVVVMRIKITNWSDCKTNLSLQTYLSVDPLFLPSMWLHSLLQTSTAKTYI